MAERSPAQKAADSRRAKAGSKAAQAARKAQEDRALAARLNPPPRDPKVIAANLDESLRQEISDCYPRGLGMDAMHAGTLVALGLCTIVAKRGPFGVDVEWTPLGRAVAAVDGVCTPEEEP